jgi:uncharacterized damage-inducible protein DinB
MTEAFRIADELRRAMNGDPWHGLPFSRVIEGVSARDAAEHPLPGAASIWEVLFHMTAWTREVHRRLLGGDPAEPEEGDWPTLDVQSPEATSDQAWQEALSALTAAHENLLLDLERFPDELLDRIVGSPSRSRELGTGISVYVMLHGLVQHQVYHTAQIATLKRVLAAHEIRTGQAGQAGKA